MNRNTILSWILKVLFFFSLLFIVIYLIKHKWLGIPVIYSFFGLFFSIFLLIIGFMIDAGAWHTMVKSGISSVSYRDAFISSGKYIFAKYIPGKFWIVLGKAGYLKGKYGNSLITLSSYSIAYQAIGIIAAVLIGFCITYNINIILFYVLLALTLTSVFVLFFFQKSFFLNFSLFCSWSLKRKVNIPALSRITLCKVIMLSITNWLIWSLAFFLFIRAITAPEVTLSYLLGLVFPISTAIGIIVLIAPGGLGIREGFLTLGLTALGMPPKEAASVAILSRLWFIIGETIFFLSALSTEYYMKSRRENRLF